jgi:integrase
VDKRSTRAGVEDRWHRPARRGEDVAIWCTDKAHGQPETLVPTTRHGQGRRWLARWVDHDGIERSKAFDRKAHAHAHVTKVTAELTTGTYVDPKRAAVLFSVVAERWFTTKERSLKPSTVGGYRSLLDVVVLPRWGQVKLGDIAHQDVQAWVNKLTSEPEARARKRKGTEGLSASRAIHAHQILHQVLKDAVRSKYITANPADYIQLPRPAAPEEKALTHDQVRALADAAGELRTQVLLLAYSGMRYGECAALRVSDLELGRRRVRVSKSVTAANGKGMVQTAPKTHQSRTVPIPQFVADALKEAVTGKAPGDLVFDVNGGWRSVDWFRVRFDKAAAKAGLTGITPKTLRHTAGSLALASGASVVTTQKLLGHKSALTTMNVYSHMLPDDFDNLTAAMDKAAGAATPIVT